MAQRVYLGTNKVELGDEVVIARGYEIYCNPTCRTRDRRYFAKLGRELVPVKDVGGWVGNKTAVTAADQRWKCLC